MKEFMLLTCLALILGGSYILLYTYAGSSFLIFFSSIILVVVIFQLAFQYIDRDK